MIYKNIFYLRKVQNYISKIKLENIPFEIKIKLFIFSLENWEKVTFTENFLFLIKKIYFSNKKEIFEYLIKTNFSFYEFYKIIYLLDLPLNRYFSDLFLYWVLNENYNLNKNETFEINKNWWKFLENMVWKEFETMILLIKNKYVEIDEKIFYQLENEKIFFASIIFQKKFFKSENNNYFINYLDKKIIEKKLNLNEIQILKNFKIDIFNLKIEEILKIIKRNYFNDFKIYLKTVSFKINFLQKYLEIYENIESNFTKNFFAEFIAENTINFWSLDNLFFLEKINFFKNIYIYEKKYFKKFYNYNFENESYKDIINLWILFLKYTRNEEKGPFIWNLLLQNWKVRYCLLKAMEKFIFNIPRSELKIFRRKTFFVRHFPMNIFHFVNYKILRK